MEEATERWALAEEPREPDPVSIAELASWVWSVASRMGLDGWEIVVGEDVEDSGNLAENRSYVSHRKAVINFRSDWRSWSIADLKDTVVHELAHCVMQQIDDAMSLMRHKLFSTESVHIVGSLHEDMIEAAVDTFTRAICRNVHTPSWEDRLESARV